MAEVDNKVPAEVRTQFGKGFARRLRVAGQIPAVVYGHGAEVMHIAIPARQVTLLLRKKNAILDLQIDGKSQLTLVKDVQKDPVRQIIEHIDLVVVTQGEKVLVNVPLHIVGTQQSGAVLELDAKTVPLLANATHIPEYIEINIDGKAPGFKVTFAELELPSDAVIDGDSSRLVVHVHAPSAKDLAESSDELAAELADDAAHAEHKAEIHAEQHDAEKAAAEADAELSGAAAAAEAAE